LAKLTKLQQTQGARVLQKTWRKYVQWRQQKQYQWSSSSEEEYEDLKSHITMCSELSTGSSTILHFSAAINEETVDGKVFAERKNAIKQRIQQRVQQSSVQWKSKDTYCPEKTERINARMRKFESLVLEKQKSNLRLQKHKACYNVSTHGTFLC